MSEYKPNLKSGKIKGRGAGGNPPNRFQPLELLFEEAAVGNESNRYPTRFYKDHSRSIISVNDSPDVRFDAFVNPYRGCEHGCIYCYARPTHEYLGLSPGLDFETQIFVKEDAPHLLRRTFASPKWKPRPVGLCGVTDPYQPVEKRLRLTRRCLKVFRDFRNPVGIITKNSLVVRDADILQELAGYQAASVAISLSSLDYGLIEKLEPRTARPRKRLEAIEKLSAAGIPVGVLVAPVIPGLTDHEIPAILRAAREAGAQFAGFIVLRLPYGLKELFQNWLDIHLPDRKNKILSRLKDIRQGKLNENEFHLRMAGKGVYAEQIRQMFQTTCRKYGLSMEPPPLSAAAFRLPGNHQLSLFDETNSPRV